MTENFVTDTQYSLNAGYGLHEATIRYISEAKNESEEWLRFRLKALAYFKQASLPNWVPPTLKDIPFQSLRYYLAAGEKKRRWDEVPENIKQTFERLGVPEKEKKFLAGVEAQFDSEFAYSRMRQHLQEQGVIFTDSREGLSTYREIFAPYFSKVVPIQDNKFAALNSAVFSGGSFIYVPKGVKVSQPLQAYFRINAERSGQFERTLIVVDEGAELTYMEGCTAPAFDTQNLHSAVVELVAKKDAKLQYITVQNWSSNVLNIVTKRGIAEENAEIRWIDCNIGSQMTVKYPGILLKGRRARGEILSIALAHSGQRQDTGARVLHLADETCSNIVSKSISIENGWAGYRGKVYVQPGIKNCKNQTECHSLLLGEQSPTGTFPIVDIYGDTQSIQHEASISSLDEEKLFYLQQRGLKRSEAISLSVNGFVNDLVQSFPLEYSVELKRLIDMEVENAIG